MKNLLSAVLFLTIFTSFPDAYAKTLPIKHWETSNIHEISFHSLLGLESLSSGCRRWNVGVTAFGVNVNTAIILCCRGNIGVFPFITCFETTYPSSPPGGGALLGDLFLSDFGPEAQKIFQQDKELESIAITKSDSNDIEGKQYYIKSDTYKVSENAKKGKYIRVILEPEK